MYTPYPDYEEEVPSGANPTITQRVTFSANGQVAVGWKKVGGTAATLYSLHTNHLGSVMHMGDASGARIDSGYAMYEPFGAFSNTPPSTNPSVTDRGFTGSASAAAFHQPGSWLAAIVALKAKCITLTWTRGGKGAGLNA